MSRKTGSISIREKKRRRAGYSLIAPACLVLLVIFFVPLVYAFAISISDSDAIINNSFKFVGLKNYFSVMTNSKFLAALGHTCFFVLTTITLEFIIGFVVALLLYREVAGSRVFRLIFAVPLMVAPVVSGLQWRWLFADQYGIINALMNKLERHYGKTGKSVKDQAGIGLNGNGAEGDDPCNGCFGTAENACQKCEKKKVNTNVTGRSAEDLRERLNFIKKYI